MILIRSSIKVVRLSMSACGRAFMCYFCTINNENANDMKNTLRKMYMTTTGAIFTESYAREYYGIRFDTALLAKVIVDKDGNVKGTW